MDDFSERRRFREKDNSDETKTTSETRNFIFNTNILAVLGVISIVAIIITILITKERNRKN